MITLTNVTKRYRPHDPPALEAVTLSVQPGERVVLLGPSGAGKSTLIRCINGLVTPDQGEVTVGGRPVTGAGRAELQAVRRGVGMIFQEYHLIDRLPVLENLLSGRLGRYPFWRAALGLWTGPDLGRARQLLQRVGLQGQERALARELSGGQRQRVAIARAMMQQPYLLLGDEPVAALDPVTARSIIRLIAAMAAEAGLTTLLSLHDVGMAREFATRAVGMANGRVLFDGPVAQLSESILARIYGEEPGAGPERPERLERLIEEAEAGLS